MVRMRVLDEAYKEVLALDPQTAISKNLIRKLAIENRVSTVMVGRKRLINFDALLQYLANPPQEQPEKLGGIRRIEK
jgi:excisionase family DNA binding protein